MATYKVIQDVEAEDKLLGPLTLRQFIYAGVAAISLYLCYFSATHNATFMIAIFLPFAVVCGFFAFPWGRDQPTEIWALAKIRFMLKPRRRIWDQSGTKDLVTVTAPKKIQVDYTNGLSETEVQSRLHALADTIDSRGWAIKNANLNLYTQPSLVMAEPTSDRLIGPMNLPQEVSNVDVQASDDMLDEQNNARAQAVDDMIEASARAHREQIIKNMQSASEAASAQTSLQGQSDRMKPLPEPSAAASAAPGNSIADGTGPQGGASRANNYWFLNQPTRSANIPANMVTFNTQVVTPGMNANGAAPSAPASAFGDDEQNLMQALDAKKQELPTTAYYSHLHTIQPLSAQQQAGAPMPVPAPMPPSTFGPQPGGQPPMGIAQAVANGMPPVAPPSIAQPAPPPPPPPVTPTQQAAILQLANNNDLNVATLAREADRVSPDEVVIKLH